MAGRRQAAPRISSCVRHGGWEEEKGRAQQGSRAVLLGVVLFESDGLYAREEAHELAHLHPATRTTRNSNNSTARYQHGVSSMQEHTFKVPMWQLLASGQR